MANRPIATLSTSKETRELLRALDVDKDGALSTGEVDVDSDGYLDCARVPKNWMEPDYFPVQNALFRAGLITRLSRSDCEPGEDRWEHYVPAAPDIAYRRTEEQAIQRLKERTPEAPMTVMPASALDSTFPPGIIFVPDIHGNAGRYRFVVNTVTKRLADWLALEMFPSTMQHTIDCYLQAPSESAAFHQARAEILTYVGKTRTEWLRDFDMPDADPASCPYFILLALCRQHRVKVRAIDSAERDLPWHGDPLNVSVTARNLHMAKQIPVEGKHVMVFGGKGHFTWYPGANVQDFLVERVPSAPFFIVDFERTP